MFAVAGQSSATIAKLLVEKVVSRHGVPSEILSEHVRAFLMKEVETLMGYHKLNTTAYHPQTDGLVERCKRTLTSMLATTVEKGGAEWDDQLPYVLFAYRASQQASTRESPFYLLYGRDPRLPVSQGSLCISMSMVSNSIQRWLMPGSWRESSLDKPRGTRKPITTKRQLTCLSDPERGSFFTSRQRRLERPESWPGPSMDHTESQTIFRIDRPEQKPLLVAIDRL